MSLRGVAPETLLAQVKNTAAWCLDGPVDGDAYAWRRALLDAPSTEHRHDARWSYFKLLLSAHFATVATFVPTDVDSHIRHHAWQACDEVESLEIGVDVLDLWETWPVAEVSARVVESAAGPLSGHDGELMSVRAGALGRAIELGADGLVDRLVAKLDAAIDRHAAAFESVADRRGRELEALQLAPTIAHNLGDLSRVVSEWPSRRQAAAALKSRFGRLGRAEESGPRDRFARVSTVNRLVTAEENHRFLALRAAKPLRLGRSLLMGLGPFFEPWGLAVARDALLAEDSEGERLGGHAAVVAALLEGHLAAPALQGFLRALSGLHRALPGGLDALADKVPARLRKTLRAGAVREALGVSEERFTQRMFKRYTQALPPR